MEIIDNKKKMSPEFCEKIRLANLGKKASDEAKKNMRLAHLGHTLSKESIAKRTETRQKNGWWKNPEKEKLRLSLCNKGRVRSEETRKKYSVAHLKNPIRYWLGKKHSEETNRKISQSLKGRNNHSWNKGLTAKTDERLKAYGKKISLALKGRKKPPRSEEYRKNLGKALTGLKRSDEVIKRLSESHKHYSPEHRARLREIRLTRIFPTKDTKIEVKIQDFLKLLNIEFTTHQVMNIPHRYQCDAFIPSINLVIECDGNYWHDYPNGTEIDHIRTKELEEAGYKILRLWETEIHKMSIDDFQYILSTI